MFSALQAARLAQCSRAQLAHWRRNGLVVPSGDGPHPYSFRDVVALRLVAQWLRSGLSSAQVRHAVRYVRESGHDLASLRLVSDGATVWACADDGQVLDALRHGQLALFVSIEHIVRDLDSEVAELDADRTAFVAELTNGAPALIDLVALENSNAVHA